MLRAIFKRESSEGKVFNIALFRAMKGGMASFRTIWGGKVF